MTNFGASFKKARESKGISLDQVARQTRISSRFLAAIEDEDFQVLPGGIFNKGFVRAFAEHVGLNGDQAVAEYERLATVREPDETPQAVAGPPRTFRRERLYPVALGILAIAIAAFYVATREPSQSASPPPAPVTTVTPPAPAAQHQAPAEVATSNTPAAVPQPAPEPPPVVVAEPAPPPTGQMLTLDVEAREQTWIKVTTDGNAVNTGELLEPGMTRKFTAESSLNISTGNAAGVTLKVNDMPLKPLGKSGQVRTVTITTANLKDFIG